MAFLAPIRMLHDKDVPQTGGEAFRRGGVRGLVKAALSAPGGEALPFPAATVTKLPSAARGAFRLSAVPQMVKKGLSRVTTAQTGKPINLPAFRAESGAALVPNRGVFYSLHPRGTQLYLTGARRGVEVSKSAFRAKNPLVIDGDQFNALGELQKLTSGAVKTRLEKTTQWLTSRLATIGDDVDEVEKVATHVDRTLAKAARSLKHDAIIYRNGAHTELVDLGKVK